MNQKAMNLFNVKKAYILVLFTLMYSYLISPTMDSCHKISVGFWPLATGDYRPALSDLDYNDF